jgi:outer membrane protein assembly factor BamB
MSPLVVGAVAVFTQDDVVYGLRLGDGRRSWSWTSPRLVADMWRWQSLVVVLAEPRPGSRDMSQLTGLDSATGRARWALRIPGYITGDLGFTADGGLAMVRADGTLQVVDLSGGRVRWARPAGFPPDPATGNMQWAMAVAPGMVLLAVNGQLTSYDDRTARVRWTEALNPVQLADGVNELSLQVYAGLIYLTAVQQRTAAQWTPVLLGISAVSGRLQWRFVAGPGEALQAIAGGLVYITTNSGDAWLYHLDPATGRVRWRVASGYPAAVPLATSAGFITGSRLDGRDEISLRAAATGVNRWAVSLFGLMGGGNLSVFPAGPLVVVTASSANRPYAPDVLAAFRIADGERAWQITMPTQVPRPLSAVPGGMLVQSATVVYGCE